MSKCLISKKFFDLALGIKNFIGNWELEIVIYHEVSI